MNEPKPAIDFKAEQQSRRHSRLKSVEQEPDFIEVVPSVTTADGLSISYPEPSAVSYDKLFEDDSISEEYVVENEVTADEMIPEIVPVSAKEIEEYQIQHLKVRQRYGYAETKLAEIDATAQTQFERKIAEAKTDEQAAVAAYVERIAQLESARRHAYEAIDRMHDRLAVKANETLNIRRLDDTKLEETAKAEHKANTTVVRKIREDIEAGLIVQGEHESDQQAAFEEVNKLVAEYEEVLEKLTAEEADRDRFKAFKDANETARRHLYAEENTIIAKKSANIPLESSTTYDDALAVIRDSQSQNRLDTEVNKQLVAGSESKIADLNQRLAELPVEIAAAYAKLNKENEDHMLELDVHSKDSGLVAATYESYLAGKKLGSTPPMQIAAVVNARLSYQEALAIRDGKDSEQLQDEPVYDPSLMLAFLDRDEQTLDDTPSSIPDQNVIRTGEKMTDILANIRETVGIKKLSQAAVAAVSGHKIKIADKPTTLKKD